MRYGYLNIVLKLILVKVMVRRVIRCRVNLVLLPNLLINIFTSICLLCLLRSGLIRLLLIKYLLFLLCSPKIINHLMKSICSSFGKFLGSTQRRKKKENNFLILLEIFSEINPILLNNQFISFSFKFS